MSGLPKISIITPSYNQGQFIEDTILSVIGQGYPNLEYIIIDGGSTDNTVDVIKKYQQHLAYWVSEKDNGQSHAINKGFGMATGHILAWLNSDDLHMPSTLSYIASLADSTEAGLYFGNCLHFKESASELSSFGSNVTNSHQHTKLSHSAYIIQPSSFWTMPAWQSVGPLREDLHFGFDWEWFLRAEHLGVKFHSVSKCLSMYRLHNSHKSGTGGTKRQDELSSIYDMYSKKAGTLFRMLIEEDVNFDTFSNRLRLRLFGGNVKSYEQMLKIIKQKKYADFTADEIREVRYMIM